MNGSRRLYSEGRRQVTVESVMIRLDYSKGVVGLQCWFSWTNSNSPGHRQRSKVIDSEQKSTRTKLDSLRSHQMSRVSLMIDLKIIKSFHFTAITASFGYRET